MCNCCPYNQKGNHFNTNERKQNDDPKDLGIKNNG